MLRRSVPVSVSGVGLGLRRGFGRGGNGKNPAAISSDRVFHVAKPSNPVDRAHHRLDWGQRDGGVDADAEDVGAVIVGDHQFDIGGGL